MFYKTIDSAIQELNKFKFELEKINHWNKEAKFLIVSVNFDNIRTGKNLYNRTCDLTYTLSEINHVIKLIEDWEVGESCHYSFVIIYNSEVICEFDTYSVGELEEY